VVCAKGDGVRREDIQVGGINEKFDLQNMFLADARPRHQPSIFSVAPSKTEAIC